jgi:hypothetical protein
MQALADWDESTRNLLEPYGSSRSSELPFEEYEAFGVRETGRLVRGRAVPNVRSTGVLITLHPTLEELRNGPGGLKVKGQRAE